MMLIEAEAKVGGEKGRHSKDRKTYFSGARVRRMDTRLGMVYLYLTKLRKGGYVPFFMIERKRSELALAALVQEALDPLLDNRPEKPVLLLKAALILSQEAVKVMKEHTVEDSAFWMSGAIDSDHIRSFPSRNRPISSAPDLCPSVTGRCSRIASLIALESKQELTKASIKGQPM